MRIRMMNLTIMDGIENSDYTETVLRRTRFFLVLIFLLANTQFQLYFAAMYDILFLLKLRHI